MKPTVNGAELFYTTRGRGPVCLVLNLLGTRPHEHQMPAALDQHLTLVFVDLRGTGRSTGDIAQLDFDLLVHDLEAVRRDLGVEQVIVLGHSILALLAIEYARRCPGTVSQVIAVGAPPFGDMARIASEAARFFAQDASHERKRVLLQNLARLPDDASLAERTFAQTPLRYFDPQFDAAADFPGAVVKPEIYPHLLGPLTQAWDIRMGAGAAPVPLLIAHGRYDYVVPHDLWAKLAPGLPNATLHVFERSGHHPFREEPDAFVAVVTAWLSQPGTRA